MHCFELWLTRRSGLVQTSLKETIPWYSFPLIVSRESSALGPELAYKKVEYRLLWRMSLYIFWGSIFITQYVCVLNFIASPLWCAVSSLYIFYICTDNSLNVALWLTRRLGLYYGHCLNLLRGDRALIPVPSDC